MNYRHCVWKQLHTSLPPNSVHSDIRLCYEVWLALCPMNEAMREHLLNSAITSDRPRASCCPSLPASCTPQSLDYLNDDVLVHVMQILYATRAGLKQFSMACRRLRRLAMPILFRSCYGNSSRYWNCDLSMASIPASLWPYIIELKFRYPYGDCTTSLGQSVRVSDCDHHQLQLSLEALLRELPNLHTVNAQGSIPWAVLRQILSVPHVRALRIRGQLLSHLESDRDYHNFPSCPLEIWHHIRDDRYRQHPRVCLADMRFYRTLAARINDSARSLLIPFEAAPLEVMSSVHWPRLQELQLVGAQNVDVGVEQSLFEVLAGMPKLRRLVLEQAHDAKTLHRPIWPQDSTRSLSWPDLEELVLSHPHPDDKIFEHLPSSLKHLSLRCWPRHYLFFHYPELRSMRCSGWSSPILTSSEMLRVLSVSALTQIARLEIEFVEDDGDSDLFRCLPHAFPRLEYLKIHRYRRQGSRDVPVEAISAALASLRQLRFLWLHLDFASAPHPWGMFNRTWDEDYAKYMATLHGAANAIGRALGPSAEFICMLRRIRCRNVWLPYRIVRENGAVTEIVPRYNAEQVGEFSTEDEAAPPFKHSARHAGFVYRTGRD
ncbi:hypothetical protein BD414DRAFT_490684 [Trametes punicea]|nr:hypothetical protein BD414DRAFT_490684 [Trametes punicea]